MSNAGSLQTERARSLILAFAVSRNSSEFCRFLAIVALRDLKARAAVLVRRDLDGSIRLHGQHGLINKRGSSTDIRTFEEEQLQRAIDEQHIAYSDSSDRGFVAIPFNTSSPVQGALGISFATQTVADKLTRVELELLQLLGELTAVNSLPRMRATGMLSKIYFDSEIAEEATEFTARQLRILDEMAIGRTNAQIANELSLSESTIKQEAVKVFRMLGVSNRQRAVAASKEMGII